jgi:tRNA(adenine34) deaminase
MVSMSSEMVQTDEYYMLLALEQAHRAAELDEVPIGAVVVVNGQIIASAHNRREIDRDPTAHAEFLALREAARILDRWRLSGATVYVTLEPCPMCAGLMHQARIDRCVYGASDPKGGALGTLYSIHEDSRLNHQFEVTSGVLAYESSAMLSQFFSQKRNG